MFTFVYDIGRGPSKTRIYFFAEHREDADRDMKEYAGKKKLKFVACRPANFLQKMGDDVKIPEPETRYRHDKDCDERWSDGRRCRHSQPIL